MASLEDRLRSMGIEPQRTKVVASGAASVPWSRVPVNNSPSSFEEALIQQRALRSSHPRSGVKPVLQTATTSRPSRVLPPSAGVREPARNAGPKLPVIPQSQDVKKFIKEPSYSTVLSPQQPQQSELRKAHLAALAAANGSNGPIYVNCGQVEEAAVETYASPPSPVSSSYSELRQATKVPLGYHLQQWMQLQPVQASGGHFESFYEPIQAPNASGPSGAGPSWSSSSGSSSEYFGTCSVCEGGIVGEGTGCEAMGRRYHVECFVCTHCRCRLQGKPFYALDGKPFCHDGYMLTLEKCCKCLQPITDRILRATGKPYHPLCFTCVVCQKSLDGVPFTVDSTNQIHCIEDFHRRWAPKCSVCREPIMPQKEQEETVRVVALDRSFHVECYRCEDCHMRLSSGEEGHGCYPLDDHVLCKDCNTRRIQDLTFGIGVDS